MTSVELDERPQTDPLMMINLLQVSKRSEIFEAHLLAIAGLEVSTVLEYVHELVLLFWHPVVWPIALAVLS